MQKDIFIPKLNQTDYAKRNVAPVVNCLVCHKNKLLLVKRNENVSFYPGYWHCIAGFIDEKKPVLQKAKEEIFEETGMKEKDISSIELKRIVPAKDVVYDKIWIIHFVLAQTSTDKITLDWEATDHKWINIHELEAIENTIPLFRKYALDILRDI